MEAVIAARNALGADPSQAQLRLLLARALLAAGDPAGAAQELERAESAGVAPESRAPLLARAWLDLGQADQVIQRFGGSPLQPEAASLELLTLVARAHGERGQIEPAEALVATVIKRDPTYTPARLLAVRLTSARGDAAAAREAAAALAQAPGVGVEALTLHAELLGREGPSALEPARAAYRRAIERDPGHAPAQIGLLTLLLRSGEHEAARQQVAVLRQALPQLPTIDYLDALAAHLRGDTERAREMTDRLGQLAVPTPQTLLLSGAVQARAGQFAQAESLLARAVNDAPQSTAARRELALLMLETGRAERALETLVPALEQDPSDAGLWSLAAQAHSRLGQFPQADRAFARAASLKPADLGVRSSAARSQIERGLFEPGLRELEAVARDDVGGIGSDLALIATHVKRGDRAAALRALEALERKRPDQALPHDLRGRALSHFGDRAGARQAFEQALARDGRHRPAAVALAELDIAEGRRDQARERYEALIKRYPAMTASLAMALAELKLRSGDAPADVQAAIDRSVGADPRDRGNWLAAIALQRRLGNEAAVTSRAQAAVAALPDEPVLALELASAHLAMGDRRQGLTLLNQLTARHPRMAEAHLRLAVVQGAGGDLASARKSLERAHELAPDSPTVLRGMLAAALAERRTDAAQALVQERQRRFPRDPLGWELQAELENGLGNPKAAAQAYQQALDRGAGPQVAVLLHRSLRAADPAEAGRFEARWLKASPGDALFVTHLAESAARAGQPGQAETYYRQALRLQPDNAALLNNLAELLLQRRDPQAVATARQAAELAPFMPEVLDTYAAALAGAGMLPQAIRLQSSAVARAPGHPVLRLNLGRLLVAKGDKAEAREHLRKVPREALPPPLRETLDRALADAA